MPRIDILRNVPKNEEVKVVSRGGGLEPFKIEVEGPHITGDPRNENVSVKRQKVYQKAPLEDHFDPKKKDRIPRHTISVLSGNTPVERD